MKDVSTKQSRRSFAYYLLIFASIFLYVALTTSKNLYTAEQTTLLDLGIFGNRTDLASTMEYYFYTYAAMQIMLVFFVKKINIKWFLTLTLGASAILTVLVAFTGSINEHYVIFSVLGILQAGIWGCLLNMLSVYLPSRLLPLANQIMTAGPAIAGALGYATAAAFGDDWKAPFFVLGIIVFAAVVLYFFAITFMSKFPREPETVRIVSEDGTEKSVSVDDDNDFIHLDNKRRVGYFYAFSILMGFLFTSLYFMVNNNLSMYLKDVGHYSNDVSKWLTVLAPIFAVLGPLVVVRICEAHKNFITVCACFFGLSLLFAGALLISCDKSSIVSLVFLVIFLVSVNGGRSVSLSIASLRMRSKINTGVYSTAVNAVSSIASGITPKIITRILDNSSSDILHGWKISFLIIFIWNLVVVGLLIGFIALVKWLNRRDAKSAA